LGFAQGRVNPIASDQDAVASPYGYFIVRPQTPSSASRLKAAYYPHPFRAVQRCVLPGCLFTSQFQPESGSKGCLLNVSNPVDVDTTAYACICIHGAIIVVFCGLRTRSQRGIAVETDEKLSRPSSHLEELPGVKEELLRSYGIKA